MNTSALAAARLAEAVDGLVSAGHTRVPIEPLRSLLGTDISAAYAVQAELTRRRVASGAQVVGRKIGLTAKSVQRQLGVDQPDFGVLFDDMDRSHAQPIRCEELLQPRVEAEVAFILGSDLDSGDFSPTAVRAAVSSVAAALEIVDSRIMQWDITITDTIADNASAGLFILGEDRLDLSRVEPREVALRMFADGELVSTGSGIDCLGDPLQALAWLARTACEYGDPLRAGQIILSGALGPMIPIDGVTAIRAEIMPLGNVSAVFAAEGKS